MESQPGEAEDRPTILVVEDDEHVRELIRKTLAQTGMRVLVAGSATEAAAAAAAERVDLLLTDVGLPGPSGTELATKLRAEHPDLQVIYISGWYEHDSLADIPDGALLRKPFDLSALTLAVAIALGKDP